MSKQPPAPKNFKALFTGFGVVWVFVVAITIFLGVSRGQWVPLIIALFLMVSTWLLPLLIFLNAKDRADG